MIYEIDHTVVLTVHVDAPDRDTAYELALEKIANMPDVKINSMDVRHLREIKP